MGLFLLVWLFTKRELSILAKPLFFSFSSLPGLHAFTYTDRGKEHQIVPSWHHPPTAFQKQGEAQAAFLCIRGRIWLQKNEETCVLTGNLMNLDLKRMLHFKTSISTFTHVPNTLKCSVNHFVNLVNYSNLNHLRLIHINSDKLLLALPITSSLLVLTDRASPISAWAGLPCFHLKFIQMSTTADKCQSW